ncbi:MAG: hypothetical protein A2041_04005, partial [Bacteroidetes bacterium GWA2_31_9b]
MTNTSFTANKVNAYFYIFTSDEFINKINFEFYPYSFIFQSNSYGLIRPVDESNYIERAQSKDNDQTANASEYRIFLNDPDRSIWPNTRLAPPRVKVWANDTLFYKYNYDSIPQQATFTDNTINLEKNRVGCIYSSIAIFKINSNIDGFTAILLDLTGDDTYSTGGSDRVIYRDMRKGNNYILWDFKNDAGAEVANGTYKASSTFLGRGPTHFPVYDVEQLDGVNTSAIRPFKKLNASIYWDDTYISRWGDETGNGLMDETQQKNLIVNQNVPRTWSWNSALENMNFNGNRNTMNTWFNAIDLGYSEVIINVTQSATKCEDGLVPYIGDIYKDTLPNKTVIFKQLDFTKKFFDPTEQAIASVTILNLPANGTLRLNSTAVLSGAIIPYASLGNLNFVPTPDFIGKTSFDYIATNVQGRESDNTEKVYITINTPPTISAIADQNLCTNNPTPAIPFTVNDVDPSSTLTVTGFSADPTFVPNSSIVVGGSGTNRTVTVTPVANKSGSAIIYVMVDDGLSQVIQEFSVYVGPDLEFSGDTTVCVGVSLYLVAQETGATSYAWKYNGTTVPVGTLKTLDKAWGSYSAGNWSLTVVKGSCTSTRNFTVSISPNTSFTGDTAVCVGETLSLSADEANASYIWKKGETTVSTSKILTIPSAALTDEATDYSLYVNKSGCVNTSRNFTILVKNLPNVGLTVSGNTVDPGKDGTITINSATNGIKYKVYQGTTLVASELGTGTNLSINIPFSYLTIFGNNPFTLKADNENCEIPFSNPVIIVVRTPGITVSTISGNTTEAGGTATFTIRLNTEPSANVTIGLSSNDLTEGTVLPASVMFTPANYSANQTITVTGVNDFIIDGNISYTIITAQATSTDINYSVINPSDVSATNTDNDVAGVTVSPTSGLSTTEAGGTATFSIVLICQPSSDVTINISSSDITEGTASLPSVIFSSANWNTPQVITVTGVNDAIDDDNQNYTIITSNTISSYAPFNNLNVADVTVTNTDNDVAGITINPTSDLITTEAGGTAQFTVVLNTEPTANVSIGISSNDLTEGTVSTSNLTFTPLNWNSAQTVTITGVNDDIDDDNIPYSIITAQPSGSSDTKYNVINPSDVSVTNNDNDNAGLTVSKTNITTTEAGGSESFTVRLNTQPSSSITIGINSTNPDEGTVLPSTLTFTTANWNVAQTVTATGVNDFIDDGDIAYTISISINSGDSKYTSALNTTVSAINIDNDAAGVTVSPTSIGTTEVGGTASFSIVLTSQPTSNVTISFTGIDVTEGSIDKTSVIFTNANWNISQLVTITGLDDAIADGNIPYTIVTTATSSYTLYNGISVDDVNVINSDNDIAGITVSPITGLTTTESGGTTTFTISLNTQPTANVTINLTSLDLTEGTVSPASIVLTTVDWSEIITVTGVSDAVDDGDISYSIQTSNTISTDPNYNNKPVDDVSVTNTDDDVAGITVTPISGLTTTETGGTATFSIVLTSQPTADVTIGLSSSDATEGSVSPSSVIFTSVNWNTPRNITITGVDDLIDDDNISYNIITAQATSGDIKYSVINPSDVNVTNTDNDVVGYTVTPTSGLTTTEALGTATFTIKLNTQPTANVVVGLSSSNTAEGTVSPASLTFTSGNWNSTQTVTITGVNDFVDDGDILYTILTSPASSTDSKYSGLDAANVSVTNIDNDAAGITVSPTSGLTTTEAGGTATFSIVLTSRPTANVTIGLTSSDLTEGTVAPASVTFTPSDWNTSRTITLTGVDDLVDDDNIGYTIVTAQATSGDLNYNIINPSDVSVTNTDNDVAGITVSPTSGLTTTEAGGTATFTIVLTSEPTANVTIGLTSSDVTEGSVLTTSVVFTTLNWNTERTITVTGVDDNVVDGPKIYNIVTATATSTDGKYNIINPSDVSVTNNDNDVVGFTISPISGLSTTEAGGTETFTVRLTSQPTASVSINLTSSNTSEGIASPSSLTFTTSNWNSLQTVTVTGQNDDIDDDDIAYSVVTQAAVSSDPLYNLFNPSDVSLINRDDDAAGYNFSTTSLTYNESGVPVSLTIALNSRPLSNVILDFVSENINKGTVSPASFTFIPTAWNVPQTLNITPVNNFIEDGDVNFTITTSSTSSSDTKYSGLNPPDISIDCNDDDVAGITVSSISGNTSEELTTATFTVVLNSEPTSDVTIEISSDDTGEGTVSSATLTFTSGNWDDAQTITVTGVEDAIADGNQTYHIVIAPSVSTDDNYNGIDPDNITVVNSDNDSPGISVFPISGLITTESGGIANFTIRLNSEPTSDVTIGISSNDTDEGTVLPISITLNSTNWSTPQTVTVTGVDDNLNDGDITYDIITTNPVSTDEGYDTISFVQDVSVTNLDDIGPRAADDSDITDEDTQINTDVLFNDRGLDKGTITLSITQQPLHGTVTIESNNTITYQPNGLFNGIDTYIYNVCDAALVCDEATVSITVTWVDDIPVAMPDSCGTSLNTNVIVDVLFNDYGMEDGIIPLTIESSSHGTTFVNPDNTITFTPTTGYIGLATFVYKLQDIDGDFDIQTVKVNVRSINYIPVASDDIEETSINTSVGIDVLANDIGLNDGFGSLTIYSNPSNGNVVIDNRTITYTPSLDYIGNDSFQYLIADIDGDYDIANVTISVLPIIDSQPVAEDDSRATNYQTDITVNILANDTGLEDGVQGITISPLPINGTYIVNGDFTVGYTPNAGYSGVEEFGYQVCDTDGDCSTATIRITVLPNGVTNHIPVANNDLASVIVN